MKKLCKSVLSALLCVCLIAGCLILPVWAAPALVVFETGDFPGGTCSDEGELPIFEGTQIIYPGEKSGSYDAFRLTFDIGNDAIVPMKYTITFWHEMLIWDNENDEILDADDVFKAWADGGRWDGATTTAILNANRTRYDNFATGVTPLPQLFYLLDGGGNDVIVGDKTTITGWVGSNHVVPLTASPWVGGAQGVAHSTTIRTVAPAGRDTLDFYWLWPYERFEPSGSGNTTYWDQIDTNIGVLGTFLAYHCKNNKGNVKSSPTDPIGGLGFYYWVKYKIEASIPQVKVGFYTDAALSANIANWVVTPGMTLAEVLADMTGFPAYTVLPTAPAKDADGNAFLHWAYYNGAAWVQVPDTFPFSTAGTTLNGAGTLYEEIKLRAIYDTPEEPAIVVKYVVDGAPYGTPWNLKDGVPLVLAAVPPKTDFDPDGWRFTPPNAAPGAPPLNANDVDFTNPALYGIALNADGEYVYELVAAYRPKSVGPPVNVVVMVNVGTPDEDTIYTWLSSSGVPLHLPDVPPKAGSTPVGWFFEYTDPNDGRKKKVRVQPDGTGVDFTDPESYGLAANANGIYTFLLTPEYTPVVTPGPELPSWLLPVGGVVLFGAGGLTIGGLTLPWLLALPLLPLVLFGGGALLNKVIPAIRTTTGTKIVPPPKTGEGDALLLLPLALMCFAGLGLVPFLLRRREELNPS